MRIKITLFKYFKFYALKQIDEKCLVNILIDNNELNSKNLENYLKNDENYFNLDDMVGQGCRSYNPAHVKKIHSEIDKLCKNILDEDLTKCFRIYAHPRNILVNLSSDGCDLIKSLPSWFMTSLKYMTKFPNLSNTKVFEEITQQTFFIDDILEIINSQFLSFLDGICLFPTELIEYFVKNKFECVNYDGNIVALRLLIMGFSTRNRDILRLLMMFASKCINNSRLINFYENNRSGDIKETVIVTDSKLYKKLRSMIINYFFDKYDEMFTTLEYGFNMVFDIMVLNESVIFQPFHNLGIIKNHRFSDNEKSTNPKESKKSTHSVGCEQSPVSHIYDFISKEVFVNKTKISSPLCKSDSRNITKESLSELLDQISRDEKITLEKKDRLLYLFKLNHPEIYSKRFPL